MALTKANVRNIYNLLQSLPPFNRWKLPSSSKINFSFSDTLEEHGSFWDDGGKYHIRINPDTHYSIDQAIRTMAHEMVHLRQAMTGKTSETGHNREFYRLSKMVCKHLGFNFETF